MPTTPTYPGVYIEEIPSGVRTIVGVSTSITAFVGRALRGLVNAPSKVRGFGEFERKFGGLWDQSPMSYAVAHYFQNGGSEALIVRVINGGGKASITLPTDLVMQAAEAGTAGNDLFVEITNGSVPDEFTFTLKTDGGATDVFTLSDITIDQLPAEIAAQPPADQLIEVVNLPAVRPTNTGGDEQFTGGLDPDTAARLELATAEPDDLVLEAVNEGAWGNSLFATIDDKTADETDDQLFNLIVEERNADGDVLAAESFFNVSVDSASSRYVTDVLKAGSRLVRVDEAANMPGVRPSLGTTQALAGSGQNGSAIDDSHIVGSDTLPPSGLYSLKDVSFNLLCLPPYVDDSGVRQDIADTTWADAHTYCTARRAILIVDPPTGSGWGDPEQVANTGLDALRGVIGGAKSINAALYYPYLQIADPLRDNRIGSFAPAGAVAGIIARTDSERGVWKAPAGIGATFARVNGFEYTMTDGENGDINPLGVNGLRTLPGYGNVVWGGRTLAGDNRFASEWKYLPVRRMALYIEESLYRGLHWVVFEPNDEPLWAQIRMNVGAFLQGLFRQGAFQGTSPSQAYFVRCDSETTPQDLIDQGIVRVVVGFAPLKPAEFVIVSIQQIAGQSPA